MIGPSTVSPCSMTRPMTSARSAASINVSPLTNDAYPKGWMWWSWYIIAVPYGPTRCFGMVLATMERNSS